MPVKSSLRDKLDEDVLDLSIMQLSEVPVSEIALLPKGTTLELSNNHLVNLPENFPTLTHLVKLDLSKNRLEELPEFFGQLKNLRHLDLYSNQLERLPVSFGQLKNLKWLDLKNNPLVPALQQAAGPCITPADCTLCSKKVVALLQSMQSQMERERQRMAMEERKAEEQRQLIEEQNKERIRNEKKAAKERRRTEARAKEELRKQRETFSADRDSMNGQGMKKGPSNSVDQYSDYQTKAGFENANNRSDKSGWGRFLMMFLLALVLTFGCGILWLYIYTGGNFDQRSIERALPDPMKPLWKKLAKNGSWLLDDLSKKMSVILKYVLENGSLLWDYMMQKAAALLAYIETHEKVGPIFCSFRDWCKLLWKDLLDVVVPYLDLLGTRTKEYLLIVVSFVKDCCDMLHEKIFDLMTKYGPIINESVQSNSLVKWLYGVIGVNN